MLNIKGGRIYLRALEPKDIDFLYKLENDPDIWEISGTVTPYSKHLLRLYLKDAHRDIYDTKQLRLCICENKGGVIGLIELFNFDPVNHRAGIGVVIIEENRNKGIGAEALSLMMAYGFNKLNLRQLYANVLEDNKPSIYLFKKLGFKEVGVKLDWNYCNGFYKNEILFQKINK